jgi:anhydro-N-acetylmuramic acid kinase
MLKYVQKLYQLALAKERIILGLMSGTSLDGLDIALCKLKGHGQQTQLTCLKFKTVPYTDALKNDVKQVFAKSIISLDKLCLLNAEIGQLHGEMIIDTLAEWQVSSSDIDLVASHGQTIYHRPASLHGQSKQQSSTLQIGDGDHIAKQTGIITLSDFRQKHIAHGGEGAPLAMYGDYLLLSSNQESRVLLNIGGIANLTFIPENADFSDVVCSDIGPGNTIMDALAFEYSQLNYDKDAEIAKQGRVNESLLARLKKHPFIKLPLPKTTGPESFNISWFKRQSEQCKALSIPDQMATLNYYSAYCISEVINTLPNNAKVYVSGGGAHNPVLIRNLNSLLGVPIYSTERLGISMDAKEAILFAVLANECVSGADATFTGNKINQPNVSMGKISFP